MPRKGHSNESDPKPKETLEKLKAARRNRSSTPCGKSRGSEGQRSLPRDGSIAAGVLSLEAAVRRTEIGAAVYPKNLVVFD